MQSPLQTKKHYTARTLSRALGVTKRAVLATLKAVPAKIGVSTNRGQSGTKAWEFCVLPVSLQAQIERMAVKQGYGNAEALLNDCKGIAEAPPAIKPTGSPFYDLLKELEDDLKLFIPDPTEISLEGRRYVWTDVCKLYLQTSSRITEPEERGFRNEIIRFLGSRFPGLVRPGARDVQEALGTALRRALNDFQECGPAGLRDMRPEKSGHRRVILCAECWDKVAKLTTAARANLSLAWRELKKKGELCKDCIERHKLDLRANKSYVPTSIRRAISPRASDAQAMIKSKAAGWAHGPHAVKNHSGERAGNYFVADDVTFNIVVYWMGPDGSFQWGRPECLWMEDELSSYVLGFDLISRHYNGSDVARLKLRVHDTLGLPRYAYKFENGVWRSRAADPAQGDEFSKLVREQDELLLGEYGVGIEKFGGTTVRHFLPRNPKAKTVENSFGFYQRLQTLWPGHVGFNEREERSDASKKFEAAVRTGKAHPGEQWLSLDDFRMKLSSMVEELIQEPKLGRMRGRTPAEIWGDHTNSDPLKQLPQNMRWLLASNAALKHVGPQGIMLNKMLYADGNLVLLRGQKVRVLYHVDCPGLIHVQNPKTGKFFAVESLEMAANPRTEQEKERARAVASRVRGWNQVVTVYADKIKHPTINRVTRTPVGGPPGEDFGRQIEQDKQEHKDQLKCKQGDISRVARRASKLGIEFTSPPRNAERVIEGLDLEKEALREIAEETEL